MDNPKLKSALILAENIAAQYGELLQVEAVALAGSLTTHLSEPESDIDLYVYLDGDLPLAARRNIAENSASRAGVNNQFWEPGDEWIDKSTGFHVDVMYRQKVWIEERLERVLDRHEASVGYSTCFWHSVLTSQLLYNRTGWFETLQSKAHQPYPEELRKSIVQKNYPILRNTLSSYLYQLGNAVGRSDRVSINHRIAALLSSYFDILFAVNRLPHPGEKRLLQIAMAQCRLLPENMSEQIQTLLSKVSEDKLIQHVNALIDHLDDLLRKENLLNG